MNPVELKGNRTTRNTSKPAQTADGTDMGQTGLHLDRQSPSGTEGVLKGPFCVLVGPWRVHSAPVPWI